MIVWNLVHGCHRKSEGCKHCYVFTRDEENGVDTNLVRKTASFNLPLRRNRKGEWKIPSGTGNGRMAGRSMGDDALSPRPPILYGHQAARAHPSMPPCFLERGK